MRGAYEIVSGKWKFSLIHALLSGPKRFMELERTVTGINTRMLTKCLKELATDEVVTRWAFATIPPTVEYTLTEKGRALEPALYEIQQWGVAYGN